MSRTAISAGLSSPRMGLSLTGGGARRPVPGAVLGHGAATRGCSPSLLWLRRTIRVPEPKDREHEQRSVKDKTCGYGSAKARNAEIKPIHGSEPCTCADNQ